MNIKEVVRLAGIETSITVFITMMILAFLELSKTSMIAVYCSIIVFFGINLAVLMITRNWKTKTRVVTIAVINVVAVAALVLLLMLAL